MIWLAGHGTAWLAGRLDDDPPTSRDVAWFRYVGELDFAHDDGPEASSVSSWVFGGMGSWNDLSFQGPVREQYGRVSEDLYIAALDAQVAATNADLTAG